MPYPLFPNQDEKITIRQTVGDCYLLDAIMCIDRSGKEGREFLKSLFHQKGEHIVVTLPHTSLSKNLKPAEFQDKYGYCHDKTHNKDVFTIYSWTLKKIREDRGSVVTNSLAVRILERIVSYYYGFNWDRRQRRGSLLAHDEDEFYRHPGESSLTFLSKVLGIKVDTSLDIHKVIKLKTIYPDLPVYVSIEYIYGGRRYDSSHALMIERVVSKEDSPGEHDFILINPWNNQRTEEISFKNLQRFGNEFSIFIVDPVHYKQCKEVMENSELFDLLFRARTISPLCTEPDFIKRFYELYKTISYLPQILDGLTPTALRKIHIHISTLEENREEFLQSLLLKFPYVWLATIIICNEPCAPRPICKILASIALRTVNHEIYNYLIKNNVDFSSLLLCSEAENIRFFRSIVELEKNEDLDHGILRLRRLHRYSHVLTMQRNNSKHYLSLDFLLEESETALKNLQVLHAKKIVLNFTLNVKSLALSFHHRNTLLVALKDINAAFVRIEACKTVESDTKGTLCDKILSTAEEANNLNIKIMRWRGRIKRPFFKDDSPTESQFFDREREMDSTHLSSKI